MKITRIQIKNFRKLVDIDFYCKSTINTIVGPNGVGKSSIIDAIRIAKAILIQTYDNEAQTTLQFMGIYSPQQNSVLINTISNDPTQTVSIKITIELSEDELSIVKTKINEFVMLRLSSRLALNGINRLQLVNYLSTPIGKHQLQETSKETEELFKNFIQNKSEAKINLSLSNGAFNGEFGFHQEVISFIFRNISQSQTLFSVFPADRNFPNGDINIQLGQSDLHNQIQSYSMQPQLKFARLKNIIVNHLLMNDNNITQIKEDFKLIFESLMPGKQLEGIEIDRVSNKLSVLIKETATQNVYDIDFLSSGEKGLLLTLFLLMRTIANGGIVIIDEPELHLNPAVCKNIIKFLNDFIVEKLNVQIILTTHSADILASTKENENFQLLNLIDPKTISPIYKRDNEEATEAIKSLGVSAADILFNKGIVYLEGTTDEEFINEVLKGYTINYKITSLGGRGIIENEINILQENDKKKKLIGLFIFILDSDNKPTSLKDSENVKIIQWDRYSFENYLLNPYNLYDVIRDLSPKNFPGNRADFCKKVKDLAFNQIEQLVIFETYGSMIPKTISFSNKERQNRNSSEVADLITSKLDQYKLFLENYNSENWKHNYLAQVQANIKDKQALWEDNWDKYCRGKDLLTDIYKFYELSNNYKDYIKRIINVNRMEKSKEWVLIVDKLLIILE